MKKERPSDLLNEAIASLEIKKQKELVDLKEQFQLTYETLKPINILKSAFSQITSSPETKKTVSSTAIGMASGFLARKVLFRPTWNPIKKIAGMLLQAVVSNYAAKNSDKIKSSGQKLLHLVAHKKNHDDVQMEK